MKMYFSYSISEKKKFKFSNLKKYSNVLMITDKENASKIPCLKFLSKNPRLDFEKVLNHFFVKKALKHEEVLQTFWEPSKSIRSRSFISKKNHIFSTKQKDPKQKTSYEIPE